MSPVRSLRKKINALKLEFMSTNSRKKRNFIREEISMLKFIMKTTCY